MEDLFDAPTMAQLRALRRDRSLTIGGGSRPFPDHEDATGEPLTELIMWIDMGENRVLSGGRATSDSRGHDLVATLINAMLDPDEDASPRLPRRIVVEEPELAKELRGPLSRLGVDLAVRRIPVLDAFAEAMRLVAETQPKWTKHPADALPIYQAAAALWAAEPWEVLPDDQASALIELDLGTPISLFSSASGFDDDAASVIFYRSREDYEMALEYEGAAEDSEDVTDDEKERGRKFLQRVNALWVLFASKEVPEDDVEFVEDFRLPLGSGNAYPAFLRSRKGEDPEPPDDEEASLLRLGMDALARFCLRNRSRLLQEDPPPLDDAFNIPNGETLVRVRVTCPVPKV